MTLPIYKHIKIKKYQRGDITNILRPDLNLKQPIAIQIKNLSLDEQWEIIKLVESYFSTIDQSYKFPYPIYIISHHGQGRTKVPLVSDEKHLPKFFYKKESRVNVKESNIADKNSLIQKEIINSVNSETQIKINKYGAGHREVFERNKEIKFYRYILRELMSEQDNE
jgi:hypothetical protein